MLLIFLRFLDLLIHQRPLQEKFLLLKLPKGFNLERVFGFGLYLQHVPVEVDHFFVFIQIFIKGIANLILANIFKAESFLVAITWRAYGVVTCLGVLDFQWPSDLFFDYVFIHKKLLLLLFDGEWLNFKFTVMIHKRSLCLSLAKVFDI